MPVYLDPARDDHHRERLAAMVAPGQQTWDLSEKDEAAIRWAVRHIKRLERDLAAALVHIEKDV